VLYTDGVLDAVGDEDRFGEQRMLAALEALRPDQGVEVAAHLLEAVDAFAAAEQSDDIAIIGLTWVGVTADDAAAA